MYAFVTFKEEESLLEVLYRPHVLGSQKVNVLRAKNRLKTKSTENIDADIRKLFIGGIPALTTFEEFKEYFAQFGELTDSMLPAKSKDSKLNSGFGFVTFRDPRSAQRVLSQGSNHFLRAKWVF
jgi:RNA recognition motif-containing protein